MEKEKQIALRSARAARENFLLRPLADILRSILEGILEIAEAEVERAGGFGGRVSATWYASNTIDLAHSELDHLVMQAEAGVHG